MRYALASHLARNHPRQAADLFGQIARGRAANADRAANPPRVKQLGGGIGGGIGRPPMMNVI